MNSESGSLYAAGDISPTCDRSYADKYATTLVAVDDIGSPIAPSTQNCTLETDSKLILLFGFIVCNWNGWNSLDARRSGFILDVTAAPATDAAAPVAAPESKACTGVTFLILHLIYFFSPSLFNSFVVVVRVR